MKKVIIPILLVLIVWDLNREEALYYEVLNPKTNKLDVRYTYRASAYSGHKPRGGFGLDRVEYQVSTDGEWRRYDAVEFTINKKNAFVWGKSKSLIQKALGKDSAIVGIRFNICSPVKDTVLKKSDYYSYTRGADYVYRNVVLRYSLE